MPGPWPRRAVFGAAALAAAADGRAQVAADPPPPLAALDVTTSGGVAPVLRGFAATHPALAGGVVVRQADVEDLSGDVAERVGAGQSDIDVVIVPSGGVALGLELNLWAALDGWATDGLDVPAVTGAAGLRVWQGSAGHALPISVGPVGPLLAWRPGLPAQGPRSPAELLEWARQNPGRFLYPRPPLATSGRLLVWALPYLLQDADPADPADGWTRSWDYLAELGRHVAYYPASARAAVDEFRDHGCDLMPLTLGEDIGYRATGRLPADLEAAPFEGQVWGVSGASLCVPRDLPEARRPVVAALIRHLLSAPVQAALPFGRGHDWSLPLDIALSEESPATVEGHVRPTLIPLLAAARLTPPMTWQAGRAALRRWDQQIGNSTPTR